jgi:hypothetical protein
MAIADPMANAATVFFIILLHTFVLVVPHHDVALLHPAKRLLSATLAPTIYTFGRRGDYF